MLTYIVCFCLQVVYSALEPNSTRRYHTYQTHPWIVRELHTGTRMMLSGRPAVVGLSAEQTVEIAAPPKLNWSVSVMAASNNMVLEPACCFSVPLANDQGTTD